MAWKEFAYSPYIFNFDTGEIGHEPTLAVKIHPREDFLPFSTRMLVDSGAYQTLIDAKVGRSIGILDIESGKSTTVTGVSGKVTAYEHSIKLELTELGEFMEINALFVEKMGATGLLGQKDFFAMFNILFEQPKLKFKVEKVKKLGF